MDTSSRLLQGKTILVTREEHDGTHFAERIKQYGGEAITIPLIEFQACEVTEEDKQFVQALTPNDWIVFTSKNGVNFFLEQWQDPIQARIAVIGEKTEQAIQKHHYSIAFSPTKYVAEVFIKEFIPILKRGEKILVVKGNLAREIIAKELRNQDYQCDEIIMYETSMPEESEQQLREALLAKKCDMISFTSSSTVRHFMNVVRKYDLLDSLSSVTFACIGPIAKKTAEKYGLHVDIMPSTYTIDGLLDSIITYYS